MGLDASEWASLCKHLGRTPTYAELGVFSVMWSEHCSYKSSRLHLKRLPSTGPGVVQGPGENAGAVDIGDGYCAVFKIESHNHPSYIEPYQGAATGVGGILRDVFTMGARPVALLNSLRFGEASHPKTPHLISGVTAGIAGYGNCMGVPTVGGECAFDKSYNGNILVNAFALGIAKTDQLFYGKATGIGSKVLYVGAKTGRDGIHGATMASKEFDDQSESQRPTVQVGDPFMEKLLLEACLEIFAADCLLGVQDMGAAGLTSSSVEMASRGGTGMHLDLDAVPRRTRGLSPYELLLSESQERMLMVAKPGQEQRVFEACKKWDLDVAIVGEVTDTGRFVCSATPDYDPFEQDSPTGTAITVVDIPIDCLTEAAPIYDRPISAASSTESNPARATELKDSELGQALLKKIASPELGSRHRIWEQFDHVVRNGTVIRPGAADAAVIRVPTDAGPKYLAVAVDGNGKHVKADPYQGAAMVVAEVTRNLVCSGARPLALSDCLNYGNPQNPEIMWQLSRSIDGIRDACLALDVPIVSGNVSLYNETHGQSVLPTPVLAAVGQLQSAQSALSLSFKNPGDAILLLGELKSQNLNPPHTLDFEAEKNLQHALLALVAKGVLSSAHDISEGGLALCLAECCLEHRLGGQITARPNNIALSSWLFTESPSRVVVSLKPEHCDALAQICKEHRLPFEKIGQVQGRALDIEGAFSVPVDALHTAHSSALDALFDPTETHDGPRQ